MTTKSATAKRADVRTAISEAKRALRAAAKILRNQGHMTWEQIEKELALRAAHGMTAWRAAGNRHTPKNIRIARSNGLRATRLLRRIKSHSRST